MQRGVPALDSASVVAPTERRIPGWILATAHKLVRVIHAGLHDRPYTDPGIDDERLVVERNAPRWGRRVPVRRCDRESRIPGSSRMIPAYPGLKLGSGGRPYLTASNGPANRVALDAGRGVEPLGIGVLDLGPILTNEVETEAVVVRLALSPALPTVLGD